VSSCRAVEPVGCDRVISPISSAVMDVQRPNFAAPLQVSAQPQKPAFYPSDANTYCKMLVPYRVRICARLCKSVSIPSLGCLLAKKKFHYHRLILENSVKLLDSMSYNRFLVLYYRGHTVGHISAQMAWSPTKFHRTDKPLVYGIGSSLWWTVCLETTNLEVWEYSFSSIHRRNFEQQMPLDSKQQGVAFRRFS
jgi:hypothetical protein